MSSNAEDGPDAAHVRDDRAEVTRVIGAPGGGKTTALKRFAGVEASEYGTSFSDVLFLTFTNAAKNDAKDVFTDIYADADGDDVRDRVRTLHSAALSASRADGLVLRNPNKPEGDGHLIIQQNTDDGSQYFEWFFESRFPRIDYRADAADPIQSPDEPAETTPPGNSLIAMYGYLQNCQIGHDQYHRAPVDVDLAPTSIRAALDGWDEFKQENELMQHDDYIEHALRFDCRPDASVLYVDEFQDLSPLQIALLEQWIHSDTVDRVYLGGDPHQAIYSFRGGAPFTLAEMDPDHTERVEESKRCPQRIIDTAKTIAAPVPAHDVSRVTAARSGGRVVHTAANDATELGKVVSARLTQPDIDTVFVLARTNRQAGKLAWGLREAGIPYLGIDPKGGLRRWRYPMASLLAAIRAFDDGRPWPAEIAEHVLEVLDGGTPRRDLSLMAKDAALFDADSPLADEEVIHPEQYRSWFPDAADAEDGTRIVQQLTLDGWQRDLLDGALRSRAANNPKQVRIGTIHSAKGLETDCTILAPAMPRRQWQAYHDDSDVEAEERRLFYVGLTRAKHRVDILHGFFGGKEFPPLAN